MGMSTDEVLAGVGPRLRRVRKEREVTLAGLSEATGISVSTLSRLESGLRKPSLELLLPIAQAHEVPLDELIGAPPVRDPRVRAEPIVRHGRTYWPLTRQPGGLQAFKVLVPQRDEQPEPRTHEGYEWLYVLSGRLRVVLGEHDVVMAAGEAAEFDTRVPHWFGSTREGPAEFLSLFGPQGERMHVRARPTRK
jgi:transcriptional regulator with XRE-family HTH domain